MLNEIIGRRFIWGISRRLLRRSRLVSERLFGLVDVANGVCVCVGKIKPEGMITKTIRMDEVVEEGFTTLIEDKENHVKILIDVGAGI